MVKIAIAGASGNFAQEITDALVATKKHELVLLSRKNTPPARLEPGVTWVQTDYSDAADLAAKLRGVHTVLSFIVVHLDADNASQKCLVDAAVRARVKRLAPSEWATSSFEHMDWYAGKGVIREYLEAANKDKKVLEYSLFQPGLLTNYLAYPLHTTKHITPIQTPFDFANRRVLAVEREDGLDGRITLTTMQDIANVVVRAVEFEGEWPVVGGIKGTELTVGQVVSLGEQIRGGPFTVGRLRPRDLEAGDIEASWIPAAGHPAFSPEEFKAMAGKLLGGMVLGISAGALNVTDEWNRLLPDYTFTGAQEFLQDAWRGKP